jgi:hypothetical protein
MSSHSDWTTMSPEIDRLTPMAFTGRLHSARRCIDPPRIDLTPVAGAAGYQVLVSPLAEPETILEATSNDCRVDLASVWPGLPFGMLQLTGRAFDERGRLLGMTPLKTLVKAPDWDGGVAEPLDYRETGVGVIDYLCHRLPVAREHPDDPAYMWHASAATIGGETGTDLQFPALCYPSLAALFLTGDRLGLGDELPGRAKQLADFLIDHPVVDHGPLAGLPMSTLRQDGRGGLYEEDRTTLVRIGWAGVTMLNLAAATGEKRYATYARHLADILLATQRDDGSWPYRVRIADAAVVEPYTAAGVMALFLLERLGLDTDDPRYEDAFDRGLAWILDNPVRTGLWQQMYEDVPSLEPYDNLEQWAALETAIMLLRRNNPDAVSIARDLVRYVEDQFVLFGDEASLLVPYLPVTPSVVEQYRCYWPMDFHTANYVRATLALYQATGEDEWGQKSVAAANAIVACRRPDGRLSTLMPDRRFGTTPPFSDWFNCMAHAADVLLKLGPTLTAVSRKER